MDEWDNLPISTEGWDTTFAMGLPCVNAHLKSAIADGTAGLPVLCWVSNDKSADLTDVHFASWALSGEGLERSIGTTVKLRMSIASGTFSVKGMVDRVSLESVELLATVALGRLDDAAFSKLVLDKKNGVTVDKVTDLGHLPRGAEIVFKMAMGLALSEMLPQFKHVFAQVDLQAASMSWLAPKWVDYCFVAGQDDASSYLAVLCMTDDISKINNDIGNTLTGLVNKVDQIISNDHAKQTHDMSALRMTVGNPLPPASVSDKLIPPDSDGVFVISKDLFVRNLLLPSVAKGFAPAAIQQSPSALLTFQNATFELRGQDPIRVVKKKGTGNLFVRTMPVDLSILYSLLSVGVAGSLPGMIAALGMGAATVLAELIVTGKPELAGNANVSIENLTVELSTGTILFKVSIRCDIATGKPLPEIHVATVRFDMNAEFRLAMSVDGTVSFTPLGTTHTTPTVEAPEWVRKSTVAVETILAIVGTIVTILTDGLAAILIALEFPAFETFIQLFQVRFSSQLGQSAGTVAPQGLQLLVTGGTLPIQWARKSFTPTRVKLNNDLGFSGHLSMEIPPWIAQLRKAMQTSKEAYN
jgi:hypothetical protein